MAGTGAVVTSEAVATVKADVVVLGAGMVGVSAALHLRKKGRDVLLVDRREPGEETSFGNTGVIEREGFVPVGFPRDLKALVRYGLNLAPEANYHFFHLPKVAPWLLALRRNSDDAGIEAYAAANDRLCRHAVAEHRALTAEAGAVAERLVRPDGWIRIYRTPRGFAGAAGLHALADRYGARYQVLSDADLSDLEPSLARVHRAVLWPECDTVSWPGGLVKAYADLFRRLGGRFAFGEARSLTRAAEGWRVATAIGTVEARDVVVALGPWALDVLGPLGLHVPLAPKRGYHLHFGAAGNARLKRPIVDVENGFCLTPMERGIRLTTGVEFADRDAPPTPRQIEQLKPIARALFPLAEERDEKPWLGRRPALPDSLPIIGPAPGHPGLWLDFGHGHLGFTQGPVSGRLIAEMVVGETPFVDPSPFRAERFLVR
jgi:D-amino-acid dehydrogenase